MPKDATQWDKAQKIRNYIAVVEGRLAGSADQSAVQEWIIWARSCAAKIDPFEKVHPTLLHDVPSPDGMQ